MGLAIVFADDSQIPVQAVLLAQGEALTAADMADKDCAMLLAAAEAEARKVKRGAWMGDSAIKNAESPDDILTGIGRFTIVEGRVLSVRQAGATTYVNFGFWDVVKSEKSQLAGHFNRLIERKVAELGWTPLNYVVSVSSSITGVLEPAGLTASKGLLTALAFKTPTDPRWNDAKDVQEFRAFLKEWYPKGDAGEGSNVIGYVSAFMTVKVLQMCGDDRTRENLLRQATNMTRVEAPLLLPGITITTTPQRYSPYTQMQIARFDGTSWVPEGPVISTDGLGQ